MASSEPLSLSQVLSESRGIIKLQHRHFLTLSLLFLFPFHLSSFLYLTLQKKPFLQLLFQSDHQESPHQFVLLPLLYALICNLLFLFSAASVSFSTYRVSRDEPVDLISSLKSILRSFWPLVSTCLVIGLIVGVLVTIPFVILAVSVYKWLHGSSYFTPLMVLIGLIFAFVIIYLQVKWMLVYAVAVVESKWGFAPLKRSADLVKGNRGVALKLLLYFGIISYGMYWTVLGSGWGRRWDVLFLMLLGSFFLSQIILLGFVAVTVLYIYCRESHEGVLPSQDIHPQKFPLLLQ